MNTIFEAVLSINKRNRSRVQGLKVPFLSPDCIWDAYLREKRQLRQI